MDSLTFIFSDFCDIPAPPAPDFPLPDTICLGDTTRTAATRNILADQRTWNITGPGLSVTINDSLNVGFRPTQPGQFKVGQKVWFLGCGYEYERILTVLPPLSAQILPDSILCDGPPGLLSASANRPLTVYLWDNGEASPTISVFEEKTYSMTATDGFCSANDSAKIIFVSKIVGAEKPILLPNDTSVCAQTLPFLLKPASSFGNQFSLVGQNLPLDSTFLLKNSGVVTVQTTIAGCIFSEKFTLSVVECLPKIYFPTAFSPNGDGLNDSFGPQGAGFEAVKLSIFDRWGNLWYEGRGASPGWAPERCHEGVFTYLFEFKNLYTNSMELIAGSVTVAN